MSAVANAGARASLDFVDVLDVGEALAVRAAEFAGDVHSPGPKMGAVDALGGALARREGATVVSADRDLTHDETVAVLDVDEYRN